MRNSAPISRPEGVTATERYLKRLCDQTFLSLWSYSGVYRDQRSTRQQGKEVCDLLVVFDDDLIIFSDKACAFPESGSLEQDWARWFRKAIKKSAEQVWGAERWIRRFPNRLFLDRTCTQRLPIDLPGSSEMRIHRIVVAHNLAQRCRKELGGSGSLMIDPSIEGPAHWASFQKGGLPFTVGWIDRARGFVHVLDDTSVDTLLGTLDTARDFIGYLCKKEELITTGRLTGAAGEEELLAHYLGNVNASGEHDFVFSTNVNGVLVLEGHWESFKSSPQRKAQLKANEVSYFWDALIETFNKHLLGGTQYTRTHPRIGDQERAFRFMARESRTRRRLLSDAFLGLINKIRQDQKAVRVIKPSVSGDPYWVFVLLPEHERVPYKMYREARHNLLYANCMVTKLIYPDADDILGVATEPGEGETRSEDLLYIDGRAWSEQDKAEAQRLQDELGLLTNVRQFSDTVKEYPE